MSLIAGLVVELNALQRLKFWFSVFQTFHYCICHNSATNVTECEPTLVDCVFSIQPRCTSGGASPTTDKS